jgi:hypothetical protein
LGYFYREKRWDLNQWEKDVQIRVTK